MKDKKLNKKIKIIKLGNEKNIKNFNTKINQISKKEARK